MPLYPLEYPIPGGNSLIRCPICDAPDSRTIHSRSDGAGLTGRKRRCAAGHLFTTRVDVIRDGVTQETIDGVAGPDGRMARSQRTTYSLLESAYKAERQL